MRRSASALAHVVCITLAACLIYAISSGIRSNFAVMLPQLVEHSTLSYGQVSLVLAVGQFIYGAAQPVFGILALKKSNKFVLLSGTLLIIAGLALTPLCHSEFSLMLTLGIMFHAGTGALCFGIVMGAIAPILGKATASAVSGIINAGTGIGTVFLSPLMAGVASSAGVTVAMTVLTLLSACLLPVCLLLTRSRKDGFNFSSTDAADEKNMQSPKILEILGSAVKDSTFIILLASFSVCGFHMGIICTHFFSQMLEYGIDESMATIAYSVFGIATMTGAIACGYICLHHSLKNVLGTLYALRALIAFVFIFFMPKDLISVMIFITLLGLTCDATITPTSELISHKYGPSLLGVLFGAAYLCHQFGSFLSSSIGGFIVDRTGNYETVWIIDIALCSFASLICYAIGESRKHQKNDTAARHADSPMHLPSLLNIR